LLYGAIGDSIDSNGYTKYGISGSSFATEMQYLQEKCEKIKVRINSIGGSVLDGYSIVSSILNSKVPCDTYIDGLAASIAGVIAVAGKKCYIMDYGTVMVHNPSGGSDMAVQNLVKDTLSTILSNRCSKTKDEMDKMMDAETWMDAKTALNNGLVDEIISSGKKIKIKKNESLENMALIYNKLINKPNMEKINNVLKLKNEATEENAIAAIEALNTEKEALFAEVETLKNRLAAIDAENQAKEDAAKTALTNKATELVNKAVADKKIAETEKEVTLANASSSESNFEFVKNMLDKVNGTKIATKVFDIKNVTTHKGVENREDWKFSDWSKKDDKGLLKMKNENPELFEALYNKEYKK
jgi:ATP-dependent Clp protease protease subunit